MKFLCDFVSLWLFFFITFYNSIILKFLVQLHDTLPFFQDSELEKVLRGQKL